MSDKEEGNRDTECLFNAAQYLIISMMGDLASIREHIGDEDGILAKETIDSVRENIVLLDKICDEFIDLEDDLSDFDKDNDDEDNNDNDEEVIDVIEEAIDTDKELEK